jgi:hypothetical protein
LSELSEKRQDKRPELAYQFPQYYSTFDFFAERRIRLVLQLRHRRARLSLSILQGHRVSIHFLPTGGRIMSNEVYLHLQHSESVVAGMAATIFAGYLQSRQISENNEEAYIRKSVEVAIKLAGQVDEAVRSDDEWLRREGRASSIP